MNGVDLQAKIYRKLGEAAKKIGKLCTVITPEYPLQPLAGAQKQLYCSFTQNYDYNKPDGYGTPEWLAVADGNQLAVFDYLQNDEGIWFIAAKQHLLPILAIECHRVAEVRRINIDRDIGDVSYMADTAQTETAIMQGWPCSIVQGTKGERNATGLPTDERTPWWSILLPLSPGVIINPSDVVLDDLGRRYVVSSPELTDLGWRLTASMQGA